MDARTGNEVGPGLTFAWLYRRVQDHVDQTKSATGPSRLERRSFWIAIAAAVVGFAVATTWSHWLPGTVALWAVRICLAVEVVGVLTSLACTVRRELPQFHRSRQAHANEMDLDYRKWQALASELRQFPLSERQSRLRFVRELGTNMDRRMGLVFGSTQKLGVFPVLIALYFQFRNWEWGDWTSAFDLSLPAALLILLILILYGMGWLLIGLRTRMDSYAWLLQESLEVPDTLDGDGARRRAGAETGV